MNILKGLLFLQKSSIIYVRLGYIQASENIENFKEKQRKRSWNKLSRLLQRIAFSCSNYLQISSKYSNTMQSICKTSLKKCVLEADENGRMLFLHNEFLLYIFKCKWNRENQAFADKNFYLCQFSNKKHLLRCKVKYNDETIKIQDG